MIHGPLTIRMLQCNWLELIVQLMVSEAELFTFCKWTHGCGCDVKKYLKIQGSKMEGHCTPTIAYFKSKWACPFSTNVNMIADLFMIVLGDGGHHGMVNNNGCQELPLIPPIWIASTNRHTHLPLDVGKVKESDWMLERSRNQIGCWKGQRNQVGRSKESSEHVYWLRLFKQWG